MMGTKRQGAMGKAKATNNLWQQSPKQVHIFSRTYRTAQRQYSKEF